SSCAAGWGVGCFFFQAEDGIRDLIVTGVQTCALPILREAAERIARLELAITGALYASENGARVPLLPGERGATAGLLLRATRHRSEERRVGKEGRSGGSAEA